MFAKEFSNDSPRRTDSRSPLVVIFITVFIDLIGFGIVIPVLPFYAESAEFGATPREIGFLLASYSIMQFIFTPILGGLSDKYGRRPVLFFSILGSSLGFLITGMATTLWLVFAGRILDGITGGNISTAQAYIADVTTPENRAKGMGLIGAAFGLGFIFGPALGGILSRYGIHIPFYVAAALAFFNAILLYFVLPESLQNKNVHQKYVGRWTAMSEAFRKSQLAFLILINFLLIFAFTVMTSAFALYTQSRFAYGAQENGWLFFFIGILAVILQGGLTGMLARRFGEINLIIAGSFLIALALAWFPAVTIENGGLYGLLGILALLAVGNGLATPALQGAISRLADAESQGTTLGVSQSFASLARALAPILTGFLLYSAISPTNIDDASIRRTFWTGAFVMLLCFLFAVFFRIRQGNSRTETADTVKG